MNVYSMEYERLYRDISTLMEKPLELCFLATTKLAHFAFIVDSVITYTLVLSREL